MSRRQEDLVRKPPSMRSRDREVEYGPDHHLLPTLGHPRDERPLRPRRSYSPRPLVERPQKTVARDQGRNSLEKREYERHTAPDRRDHIKFVDQERGPAGRREYERPLVHGRGNQIMSTEQRIGSVEKSEYDRHFAHDRGDQIRCWSPPPIGWTVERPDGGGRILDTSPPLMDYQRKYEYEYPKYAEYVDDSSIGVNQGHYYDEHFKTREDELGERRFLATAGYGNVNNSFASGNGSVRQMVRSPEEYGITPDYKGSRGGYSTSGMHKNDSDRYRDVVSPEVFRGDGYYNDEDARHMPLSGYPKIYGELAEPLGSNEHGKRPHFDQVEEHKARHASRTCLQCDMSDSVDRENYFYSHPRVRVDAGPGYSSRGTTVIDPDLYVDNFAEAERSRRIPRSNDIRESNIMGKERTNYVEMTRAVDASKQDVDYMDSSHARIGFSRKSSYNHPIPEADVLEEHEIPAREHGRYVCAGSHVERVHSYDFMDKIEMERHGKGVKNSYDFVDNIEMGSRGKGVKNSYDFVDDIGMERRAEKVERVKADEYDNDKALKRKYSMEDDISMGDSRSVTSHKWHRGRMQDPEDHRRQWVGGTSSDFRSKQYSGDIRDHYLEADKMLDEIYLHKESRPVQPRRPSKSGSTYWKGHGNSESSKSYGQPHNEFRKADHFKQQFNWKRSDDGHDLHSVAPKVGLSNDMQGARRHVPLDEDSESFKQRVQMSFLDFSKRINENPVAHKLYKEQGKAGSLFCIVCGRSSSKEFQNTQSLVTHAYMARKPSMRAQHLGLHKAICVLMGWNSVASPDVITWAPNVLPEAEALAWKEDLILWPPVVVVHNISLSYNNHKEWKAVSPDAIGEFLKDKGFSRGKMKICLGNPGDQSVMLVKFLGTFSGLQEAEKLHKYFAENKHGRADFEQALLDIGKHSSVVGQGDTEAGKIEEPLLYGYMGISEDMDRIDYDTRKRCTIKSKQEIHDFADAPVKPE